MRKLLTTFPIKIYNILNIGCYGFHLSLNLLINKRSVGLTKEAINWNKKDPTAEGWYVTTIANDDDDLRKTVQIKTDGIKE